MAWSQLVSTSDISLDPVQLTKNKFLIGRSKSRNISSVFSLVVRSTSCLSLYELVLIIHVAVKAKITLLIVCNDLSLRAVGNALLLTNTNTL